MPHDVVGFSSKSSGFLADFHSHRKKRINRSESPNKDSPHLRSLRRPHGAIAAQAQRQGFSNEAEAHEGIPKSAKSNPQRSSRIPSQTTSLQVAVKSVPLTPPTSSSTWMTLFQRMMSLWSLSLVLSLTALYDSPL